jgi:hypothetical protein
MRLDETRVSRDADGNTILKLSCPVKDDTGPVTELRFRRMTAADLLAVESAKTEMTKSQSTISRLTGLSIAAVNQMDAYDFGQANRIVGNFLMRPRATGA